MIRDILRSFALASLLVACSDGGGEAPDAPNTEPAKPETPAEPEVAPDPVQEALEGGPYPTLILSQAWFWKTATPGPARLQIWRETADGWKTTRLEDGDSNVFHKAILQEDGTLLTIGGSQAMLKRWTHKDGAWSAETLWEKSWGGKFDRLRDMEIGDVDGDGVDEWVIATHDNGVIAVMEPETGEVIELDPKADTFVHEIEIGDVDGDGKLEFFATPSDRNQADKSQHGEVVMYRWDGSTYVRTVVDPGEETHAKEILIADVDGDGTDEFFSVQEAQLGSAKQIVKPVEIRQYTFKPDGSFETMTVGTIQDRQTRFLVPGDFDGDGTQELVAAAMKTGIHLFNKKDDGTWERTLFETNSSGFEHTTVAGDIDGDGKLELYVAADNQRDLKRFVWNNETNKFDRELIGKLEDETITWNLEVGSL